MAICDQVHVCGLLWCIRVHVHLGLSGDFMPRSPSRCLACSLVSVELEIRIIENVDLKHYLASIRTGVGHPL